MPKAQQQTQFGKAWHEWINSKEAESCLKGTATGEYLKNRLWHAFSAGWSAAGGKNGR